jgi:hypothetical protein
MRGAWLLLVSFGFVALHAQAQAPSAPVPPCGAEPVPAYAAAGLVPDPQTWTSLEWRVPACFGSWPSRFKFVIALAGHVTASDRDAVLKRLGAISKMRGIQYYSVTEGKSLELIKDASALVDADPAHRREDFTLDELASGKGLFYLEEDNRSSHPVVYAMHLVAADADHVILVTENVSPVKSFLVTLFPPASLRAAYILTRLDGADWGLYVISASSEDASSLVALAKASYVNRAQALFKHVASASP